MNAVNDDPAGLAEFIQAIEDMGEVERLIFLSGAQALDVGDISLSEFGERVRNLTRRYQSGEDIALEDLQIGTQL